MSSQDKAQKLKEEAERFQRNREACEEAFADGDPLREMCRKAAMKLLEKNLGKILEKG